MAGRLAQAGQLALHETGVVLLHRVCQAGAGGRGYETVFSLMDNRCFCTSGLGDLPLQFVWSVRGEITGCRIQSMSMSMSMIKMRGMICILAKELLCA